MSRLGLPPKGVLPRGVGSPTHGPTSRAPTKRLPHVGSTHVSSTLRRIAKAALLTVSNWKTPNNPLCTVAGSVGLDKANLSTESYKTL